MTTADLLAALNKEAGGLLLFGDAEEYDPQYLPTGLPTLDNVLGGGLVKGKISVVFGAYSTGKTLLAQYVIRSAQQQGLDVVYIDTEQAYNKEWFAASGVDCSKLIVSDINDGEAIFKILLSCVKSKVGLVVIDSLAELLTPGEIAGSAGIAELPRFLNNEFRLVIDQIAKTRSETVIFCTNQVRSGIGPGEGIIMPGGHGMRHRIHLLLKARRAGWVTGKSQKKSIKYDVKQGFEMEISIEKSKQCAPFQSVKIPFDFSDQLDEIASVVNECIDRSLIEQAGAWYKLGDQKFQGRTSLTDYVREHPEALDDLLGLLHEPTE